MYNIRKIHKDVLQFSNLIHTVHVQFNSKTKSMTQRPFKNILFIFGPHRL